MVIFYYKKQRVKVKFFTVTLLFTFFIIFSFNSLSAQRVGFMGINIGMSRDEVLQKAEENPLLEVPGNRDVEFFPVEDRKILTLSIKPEIPHIYLQFYGEKLYAITLIFDPFYFDYFALCNELEQNYGNYKDITPSWKNWEKEGIEIRVEKPAIVKYIALKEFLEVTGFGEPKKNDEAERRKLILQGF